MCGCVDVFMKMYMDGWMWMWMCECVNVCMEMCTCGEVRQVFVLMEVNKKKLEILKEILKEKRKKNQKEVISLSMRMCERKRKKREKREEREEKREKREKREEHLVTISPKL